MQLESFRELLFEIRDLANGGMMYAANVSDCNADASFNIAMYSVIERNAQTILHLFDIIEFSEVGKAIEEKISQEYKQEEK